MKKFLKKLFSLISATAIFITCQISAFSWAEVDEYCYPPVFIDEYTYVDDKGMFADYDYYKVEGYKYIFYDTSLYRAVPLWCQTIFILNENVNKEDVDKKIRSLFREYFPEENYTEDEYIPQIYDKKYYGRDAYICAFANRMFDIASPDDERIVKARQSIREMGKKLYDEDLIVAFYDFGETYNITQHQPGIDWICYEDGADTVEKYILENNIDCGIERKGENGCELIFSDDVYVPERLEIAADIYEATSVKCSLWGCYDIAFATRFGKNAIDELKDSTNIFGTPTIAGDIDLNNEQGTADIIILSKYIANSQLYPITDPTALANADMNQDKEVNSLDANILVEMTLADYENIV